MVKNLPAMQETQAVLTKVHIVKATVFPVGMCRCESSTIKKTEQQYTDAFELVAFVVLKKTLESSLD